MLYSINIPLNFLRTFGLRLNSFFLNGAKDIQDNQNILIHSDLRCFGIILFLFLINDSNYNVRKIMF